MCVSNQTRPYEFKTGVRPSALIEKWNDALIEQFNRGQGSVATKHMRKNLAAIVDDFDAIERSREKKTRVGVVGEIYVKYSLAGQQRSGEVPDGRRTAEVHAAGHHGLLCSSKSTTASRITTSTAAVCPS